MPQTRLADGNVEPLFTGLYSVLVGVVVVIMVCARWSGWVLHQWWTVTAH
jgi:hypothetical protein